MNISTTKYTLLFSLYSFPNIIIAFFAGYFADRFGRKISIIICGILIFVGEAIFVFGIHERSFTLASAGRFIFGIGAEPHSGIFKCILVVTLETLSHWNYQFLPISLSLVTASKKIGAGLNSILTPQVYDTTDNVKPIFWIALVFAIICLVSAIIFTFVEWKAMKAQDKKAPSTEITIGGIAQFPRIFWLMILFMAFHYVVVNSLNSIAGGMSQKRFGLSVTVAGFLIVSLFYF